MSMLLAGENGTEFELGLLADPIIDAQDDFGDDTAPRVTFRVATRDEEWEETSPVINTFELTNLAEWLEGLIGERHEMGEIELLESELRFSVVGETGERVTIRIDFRFDDRPQELDVDAPTDLDHIDIKIDREHIGIALAQLRHDLRELGLTNKDDLLGERDLGQVTRPDEDLNMIDEITPEPEGMGDGEDNAGER